MPFPQFLTLYGGNMTKMNMVTSLPLSILLVGLQAMTDVKFACPCIHSWNITISILIFVAPAFVAFVIMLLLLRPWKYECGWNKWKCDCSGSQVKKVGPQSEINELNVNLSCTEAVLACLTPSLVWICLCFIDGDYLSCGLTYWDGHYACDRELHPNCLNWCKPNDLIQGKKETEHEYEKTRNWIATSKTTGYALAIVFCSIAIIFVICECFKSGKSKSCGSTDPEIPSTDPEIPSTDPEIPSPGTDNQPDVQHDDPQINRGNRGASQAGDSGGASQAGDSGGAPQAGDNREASQAADNGGETQAADSGGETQAADSGGETQAADSGGEDETDTMLTKDTKF